jgi:hypothetical protein
MWKEKMYRPEHDLGLQRAHAKNEKKAADAMQPKEPKDLNDGLPA